jgi:hypothetical protein
MTCENILHFLPNVYRTIEAVLLQKCFLAYFSRGINANSAVEDTEASRPVIPVDSPITFSLLDRRGIWIAKGLNLLATDGLSEARS